MECYCCKHGEEATRDHIADLVSRYGFAVMTVEGKMSFNYTVGLWDKGLPELVIAGLSPHQGYAIITKFVRYIEMMGLPELNVPFDDITTMPSLLVEVNERYRKEIFSSSIDHSAEQGRIMQIVWPDKEGRFPGDPEFALEYLIRQPLLSL